MIRPTLGLLLYKNAYTMQGLTTAEREDAELRLERAIIGSKCWLCGAPGVEDTNLCIGHAWYALWRQK